MKATSPRSTPTRRRLRAMRQAKVLYLVPARLPVLRQSRLAWYCAMAELIVSLLLVLAAAALIAKVVPWT